MSNSLLTVRQVALRYPKVTTRQVLYAINHGKLRAFKTGWQWFVLEEDLPQNFPLRDYRKKEA